MADDKNDSSQRASPDRCGCGLSRGADRTDDAIEHLAELASSRQGEEHLSCSIGSLHSKLDATARDMTACKAELVAMRAELEHIKTVVRVLEQIQSRCRELEERFYDREVLGPIVHGLVGIADRCRQNVWRIESTLRRTRDSSGRPAAEALIQLREARTADRVEIESLLAHLGVEPFENRRRTFDPANQKCIARRPSTNGETPGRIASRVLPGYRRNGDVVRPEYVEVYVKKQGGVREQEKPS